MTAEISLGNQFHSTVSVDAAAVPASHRQALSSPWAQVVRGETENAVLIPTATPSSPEQSAIGGDSASASSTGTVPILSPDSGLAAETQAQTSDCVNAAGTKKAVWKKPVNGSTVLADTTPVMGAESWPALSESTRPMPKSSSESASKVSETSVASVSLPQGPVISNTPHKQAKPANTNHAHGPPPFRQRTMKRGGGIGGVGGSPGFGRGPLPPTPPPLPPPFPVYKGPFGNMVPAVLDPPVREGPYKGNSNWVARPMSHGVNDHSSHRNPSRRGNFGGGSRPRGEGPGPYANGYGGRHDQDRDWHGPRGSNGRDVHMPHQMVPPPHGPRGLMRSPHPGGPPFIAPQAMRPFGNPMGFDMASPFLYVPVLPPEQFRGAPFIPHAAPMFFPAVDPLPALILNQIEYYFSEANLVKDNYLRSNMDDEAWVPVTLIANFPRVQSLTNDIQLILDSLRTSMVVEVQGDKIRPRKEWKKWATTSGRSRADFGLQSPRGASDSSLPTSFQKLTVDEATTKLANGEVIAEACSSHS